MHYNINSKIQFVNRPARFLLKIILMGEATLSLSGLCPLTPPKASTAAIEFAGIVMAELQGFLQYPRIRIFGIL